MPHFIKRAMKGPAPVSRRVQDGAVRAPLENPSERDRLSARSARKAPASPYYADIATLEARSPRSNRETPALDAAARSALQANAMLEAKAVATLTTSKQDEYRQVATALAEHVEARLVLQDWLIRSALGHGGQAPPSRDLGLELASGRPSLVAGPLAADGSTLLSQLAGIADPARPLAPGVERGELLSSLVREVANPLSIAQRALNTCTVTGPSLLLAWKNPAEYARLIAGVASPGGKTTLASGDPIERVADWALADDGGRAVTVRLLQPALENYANWGHYSNATDSAAFPGDPTGAWTNSYVSDRRALEGLFNKRFVTVPCRTKAARVSAFEAITARIEAGEPVAVNLRVVEHGDLPARPGQEPSGGGHLMIATRIQHGRVFLLNPWGEEDSVSVAFFKENLFDAFLQDDAGPLDPQTPEILLRDGRDLEFKASLLQDQPLYRRALHEEAVAKRFERLEDHGRAATREAKKLSATASARWNQGVAFKQGEALENWAQAGLQTTWGKAEQDAASLGAWVENKLSPDI